MAPSVHILIPAAGASRRMGGEDKLLQDAGGKALLRRVVETALATGAPVTVTLPALDGPRAGVLAGLALRLVAVPDADQGMSRSLARGVAALLSLHGTEADGLMVLPADMPDFTPLALSDLIAAFYRAPDLILRGATPTGEAGHPVLFPRALWPELLTLTGDEGGRSVLQRHADRLRLCALPGRMALTDLDRPEDWQAWSEGKS